MGIVTRHECCWRPLFRVNTTRVVSEGLAYKCHSSTARFTRTNDLDALCDAYTFLGHIHLIEARDAPKIILPNASAGTAFQVAVVD